MKLRTRCGLAVRINGLKYYNANITLDAINLLKAFKQSSRSWDVFPRLYKCDCIGIYNDHIHRVIQPYIIKD